MLQLQVQRETHLTARMPAKSPKSRKRHRSGSLTEELPGISHTHHGHSPHATRAKASYGVESVPLVKCEIVKSSPSKKKKGHPVGPVSMETGATTPMDTKSTSGSKSRGKGSKPNSKKAKLKPTSARGVLTTEKQDQALAASGVGSKVARRRRCVPNLSSDEDNSKEVDITTPLETDQSLSVSLRKSLIQLNAFDATKQDQPGSYMVSISRETLLRPGQRVSERGAVKSRTATSAEQSKPPQVPQCPGSYRVEFDGTPTKMIFRSGDIASDVVGGVAVAREKKSKKKHHKKKHSKKSKSHEASPDTGQVTLQDIGGAGQDTGEACQDTAKELQDIGGAGQDTGEVWYTDSLKVRIKL